MKKIYSRILTVILLFPVFDCFAQQQIILKDKSYIDGGLYFMTLEKHDDKSEIWLRCELNKSDSKDQLVGTIETKTASSEEKAMEFICKSKKYIDNAKLLAGCSSVIGSGICIATGGGAGVGVPVCAFTIAYTAKTGAVDCIAGLTQKIASHYGHDDFGYAARAALGGLSASSLVMYAVDSACQDWRQNH